MTVHHGIVSHSKTENRTNTTRHVCEIRYFAGKWQKPFVRVAYLIHARHKKIIIINNYIIIIAIISYDGSGDSGGKRQIAN